MPATSDRQRRFFGLVRAVQKGKARSAGPQARKAARSMTPRQVKDFASKRERVKRSLREKD